MRSIGGPHEEPNRIAFDDLDRRWLEREPSRDDFEHLRLRRWRRRLLRALREGRNPARNRRND